MVGGLCKLLFGSAHLVDSGLKLTLVSTDMLQGILVALVAALIATCSCICYCCAAAGLKRQVLIEWVR